MILSRSCNRSRSCRALLACLTGLACCLLAGLAGAQTPPASPASPSASDGTFVLGLPTGPPLSGPALDQRTEVVAEDIRCPVCQGLSIADSPSETALAMKAEVKGMLAQGYSADQIFDYFEASYGEFIRLEPRAQGFNLVVWLAPILVLALGLLLVLRRVTRSRTLATGARSRHDARDDEHGEAVEPDTSMDADVCAASDAASDADPDAGLGADDEELAMYRRRVRQEFAAEEGES